MQLGDQVISCIKSDTSVGRRTDVFETLLIQLRKNDVISLAVDESTDNSTAQLRLFVCFLDVDLLREDILSLILLKRQLVNHFPEDCCLF